MLVGYDGGVIVVEVLVVVMVVVVMVVVMVVVVWVCFTTWLVTLFTAFNPLFT